MIHFFFRFSIAGWRTPYSSVLIFAILAMYSYGLYFNAITAEQICATFSISSYVRELMSISRSTSMNLS